MSGPVIAVILLIALGMLGAALSTSEVAQLLSEGGPFGSSAVAVRSFIAVGLPLVLAVGFIIYAFSRR
ncbi:MAG: hypothetical protein J4G14_02470 [Dehalococcoidia bacterium]|nr:hypothetical protein [Dehalococcoidia bacterium]